MEMHDDSNILLEHVADGNLLDHIERAQQCISATTDTTNWRSQVRFLRKDQEQSAQPTVELGLNTFNGELGHTRYLAVSYCWVNGIGDTVHELVRIRTPDSSRVVELSARADILRWCFSFAEASNIPAVWMDQVCVDQEDLEEKQKSVDNMHLVYRNAVCTLVVLEAHIHSESDIMAMPKIMEHGANVELRERIFADKWFTRAWTTQEYINTEASKLFYLLPWQKDLDVDGECWQRARTENTQERLQRVERAWIITHDQIIALSCMSQEHTSIMQSITASSFFGNSAMDAMVTTSLDAAYSQPNAIRELDATVKLRATMPLAFTALQSKGCLWHQDKLALLSNVTHYPHKIQILEVMSRNLSFTACVLALAIFNGDLSPLFCRDSIKRLQKATLS